MAKESEKKREKAAVSTKSLYTNIQIALYMVWFVIRVIWGFHELSISVFIGLIFLSVVNYLCLTTIFQALQYGTPFDIYQDILFVNWFVMALSMFTSYAWFFWLLIPGYALYQYGPMVKNFLFSSSAAATAKAPETAEEIEAEKKRLAKKERQASRVQYKAAR